MPYELFGHLNPRKLEPFKIAYEKEMEIRNQEMWIQGMYIRDAVISAFNEKFKYPNKPYGKETSEVDNEGKKITDAQRFAIYAMQYNKSKFSKKSLENV